MKKLLILLCLVQFTCLCQVPCPVGGAGKNAKEIAANVLKNREIQLLKSDTVTLEKILLPGDDRTRFSNDKYVSIVGYLVEVKPGGKESCNCGAADATDTHIYIGQSPNAEKADCMIVEVTPRFKKLNPSINLLLLKSKLVTVTGYLFYDEEHKQNAKNTCTVCGNAWRRTCWEVHPVCKIELTKED